MFIKTTGSLILEIIQYSTDYLVYTLVWAINITSIEALKFFCSIAKYWQGNFWWSFHQIHQIFPHQTFAPYGIQSTMVIPFILHYIVYVFKSLMRICKMVFINLLYYTKRAASIIINMPYAVFTCIPSSYWLLHKWSCTPALLWVHVSWHLHKTSAHN